MDHPTDRFVPRGHSMVRPFLALFFLGSAAAEAISPCAAQAPAQSAPARECLRINDSPLDESDWDARERARKAWVETCRQAMATEGKDPHIKHVLARALTSDGQRAEDGVAGG